MPKGSSGPKQHCPYCNKDRSLKLFTKSTEICNFCFYFDKAAALTAPPSSTIPSTITLPAVTVLSLEKAAELQAH